MVVCYRGTQPATFPAEAENVGLPEKLHNGFNDFVGQALQALY